MIKEEDSEALYAAENVLGEEANVLARLIDAKTFAALDHRVEFAISREIKRLRNIADRLMKLRTGETS